MKKYYYLVAMIVITSLSHAQPLERRQYYDISKDKVLYTVGYAHLDTEWNWDYPTTINQYIWNTMADNFKLFEKYPDYVFNFTGSRRYKMMKEYYPESYRKVADYIAQGRWFVSGSSVDEGEANISSSESVLRQVLYGNLYFRREFNKESVDYMLPDCFGFVATMPSVWSHAGLIGFSTQKLTWRSANGVPFNVGWWEGPDGKGIIASLNATDYTGRVVPRLDLDTAWNSRIQEDIDRYGLSFDYRYYGVGDVGGAPRDEDVKNATGSLNHNDSKFKVVLTSSDQIYRDITPEIRSKLPTYSGDLLLIEHSAGSMNSQSYMKRANRKNEALSRSAELSASAADWLGGATYPFDKLNNSWELVLGSQFHDILPGTSLPKAYEYAWNDEFIAMNGFSEVLKNSVNAISGGMNTNVRGKALIVYNPVSIEREDVVTAELAYAKVPVNIKVFDKNDNEVPSQIVASAGNKLTIIFLAKLPPAGLTLFDVRETTEKPAESKLAVTDQTLENSFFRIRINSNGDIANIYDKTAKREVLSKPATLDFQRERPSQWPSWNMDWNDRKNPPFDYMNKDVTVKVVEQGPVRVSLQVTKKGQNSEISQIISLSAGEAGKVIEVRNEIDWQSKEVSLKAAFPTTVANEMATYSLNTAAVRRSTNNEVKFEVPGRQWIDLTDRSNSYGISILEDCKYGSDKPDNSTIRLTLMYTPRALSYVYQGTQDWGIHNVKYGIYPHSGDWAYAKTPWKGNFINNPPIAFEAPKHEGKLGKEFSFLKVSTNQVDVMALKKAEEGDYYIVRVNELYGKDAKNVKISFPGKIVDAWEVNGQEKRTGDADFSNGILSFDMTRFIIRSFAVKFEDPASSLAKPVQATVDLPFNQDGISFDTKRSDGSFADGMTVPAEQIPGMVVSEDISFAIGSSADGKNNVMSAQGQKISLPSGKYNRLYLLAAAAEDTQGTLKAGNKTFVINFQGWTGYVGQHYNRELYFNNLKVASIANAFTKRDNIAWFSSHRHAPEANATYSYCYLYKYEIKIPEGAKSVTLPKNDKIKIFAATAAIQGNDEIIPLQPLYDDFMNNKPFMLRAFEYVTPSMQPLKSMQLPLFATNPDPRQMPRIKSWLKSIGADTVVVPTPPSIADYADKASNHGVTVSYIATGKESGGKFYNTEPIDISNILDSKSGRLKDTVFFDNGEGRIRIDLKKEINIDRINLYINQFRNRGAQIFTIWGSTDSGVLTGDPKKTGWKYAAAYGLSGRGFNSAGTSFVFDNNLRCRYLLIISDGHWHGTEYFRQIDIFEKTQMP
jgi:alpha-mannosidase